MTYSQAIEFLFGLRWFGMKPGLSNSLQLAQMLGNPHHNLRFIHVAGTNGKGSTCAMLESTYRSAGLRVGLFTSPHLVAFGERIQVNRTPISDSFVIRLVEKVQEILQQGWPKPSASGSSSASASPSPVSPQLPDTPQFASHPTFFEVVTIMALLHFLEERCDLVIWETGLGGRLDATNIVTPLASVITNIQYDHQQYLGDTLERIASEKAGIIKPGVPVITATDRKEALAVIEKTALSQNAPLTVVTPSDVSRPPLDEIKLPLPGRHQRVNAAVAVATVRALKLTIPVDETAIRAGLVNVKWPGRLQLLTRPSGQELLLDGAHNIGGADALVQAMRESFPTAKPALILGLLRDKDWPAICRLLAPIARRILLVPVTSERAAAPEDLARACRQANPAAESVVCETVREALAKADTEPFVVITGSLYLVGEALELLGALPVSQVQERPLNEWSAPEFSI